MTQRLVSADSHVVEPPDLFKGRVASKFVDQVPRMVRADVRDEWWMGDEMISFVGSAVVQAGYRIENSADKVYGEGENRVVKSFGQLSVEDWDKLSEGAFWEDVPLAGYDGKQHIKDNDMDGVYAAIIYPSHFLTMYRRPSSPLLTEIFRAYNDWLAEFCSPDANRLKGVGLVLLDDIEGSIKEMERCMSMGLGGVMIPAYPEPHLPYSHERYEPFWEAAASLEAPLGMHIQAWRCQPATGQLGGMAKLKPEVAEFVGDDQGNREPVDLFCTTDYYIRRSSGEMIFSGVFQRHPKLTLVCVEFDTGFVPYHMSRMDHTYFEYPDRAAHFKGGSNPFVDGMIPSDFWRRNVRVTFQEDPLGLQRLRDIIGPETMMWGNDYPHRESTWPESIKRIDETFKGVPQHERDMIVGGNAAKLWKIE
jgi:predicted TIM-barrel fold metal-dependent hydrolase